MAPVAADCMLCLSLRRLGLAKKKLLPVFRVCLRRAGAVLTRIAREERG